jgi:tRNA threonylcarbamoyladenosine biosynthesis protein TsaE
MKPKIIKLNNLEDTQKLAESLAIKAAPNMNFLLRGDLGAGKTTFTKYLLKALGVTSSVTSPTFVILNQYQGQDLLINHVDAYRLDKNQNVDFIVEEFDDAFNVIE